VPGSLTERLVGAVLAVDAAVGVAPDASAALRTCG
jgi:hypothetical protein